MTAHALQLEDDLIRRIRRGDEGAFDRLVEVCTPRVYTLAYRLVGNAEDAQDMAQEAFVRVYHALPRFKGEAAFSTWLYRIVVNVCYDELSRRRRRPHTLTELGAEHAPDEPGQDVEEMVLQLERQHLVQQAITDLPDPFRMVLVLYDVQGLSYLEISDILNTNVGTVKSRLNRARNLLREKLSSHRELFYGEGSPN